jgi:hypothetical protein
MSGLIHEILILIYFNYLVRFKKADHKQYSGGWHFYLLFGEVSYWYCDGQGFADVRYVLTPKKNLRIDFDKRHRVKK